jgi:GNAT superfamily N-acetyltransferase
MLREASRADIPAMQRVRMSVRENRLRTRTITEADYVPAMETNGRGWVIEENGEVVGFAVGDRRDGNIWALFVHPNHEGHGYGRQLHDAMVAWLWSQGLEQLWLTTEPGTRAQAFYEAAGWQRAGRTDRGELRFELRGPASGFSERDRMTISDE